MSRTTLPSLLLAAALAGLGSLAPVQVTAQELSTEVMADPPSTVGRISAVQGRVTLAGADEPADATLNWPVTGANRLTTASGARAEFRVGSTAVRVDGDSDLEISELDDDLLRLRLNYGSVSIRVRNPELLRDFELSTPQARVTLLEPGLLRVDVERVADTSQISVLDGSARVDGAGSSVTVNVGRHVDVSSEDVRTSVARRDGFDVWGEERDRLGEAVITTRYVSNGITGYEELDRNGSWTESVEYGPLWTPRNVALDWAPYRDGRWTWLAPWGWTWVDNAPWGYAPSHYGRWVMADRRWRWAPGRPGGRPVWAPALVGWVGGNGFKHKDRGPGVGWFPLSPREKFVPGYRVSNDYERRMTWNHNGKPFTPRGRDQRNERDQRDGRRDGLTVLPREQFEGRHTVRVNRNERATPAPNTVRNLQAVAPPRPNGPTRVTDTDRRAPVDRNGDGRPDRFDRNTVGGTGRAQPGRVITAPSQPQQQLASPGRGQTSTLAPGQFGTPDAPAQTVDPRDVGIELRPGRGPNRGNGTNGASNTVMPAPVVQVGQTRDRFNRDGRDDGDDVRRGVRQREENELRRQQRDQQQQLQVQQQLQQRQNQAQVQAQLQAQQQQTQQALQQRQQQAVQRQQQEVQRHQQDVQRQQQEVQRQQQDAQRQQQQRPTPQPAQPQAQPVQRSEPRPQPSSQPRNEPNNGQSGGRERPNRPGQREQ